MNYDTLHPPGADREWNESFYFNFYDASNDICGFMRIGIKPNVDERSMFFFLMLPDGSAVGTRGVGPASDGPLSVKGLELIMMEPEKRWRLRYQGPMARMGTEKITTVSMDLVFDCLAPTYDYRRSVGAEGERIARQVASEHLEQFGQVSGTIDIDGQRTEVEGLGERDHVLGGPRLERSQDVVLDHCPVRRGDRPSTSPSSRPRRRGVSRLRPLRRRTVALTRC